MEQVNVPSVRWEWISEAWTLFTKQWTVWVLMILITSLVIGALMTVIYVPIFLIVAAIGASGADSGSSSMISILLFLAYPIIALIMGSAASYMLGGLYNAAFKQIRGEQITIGDAFSGGKYFTRLFVSGLLIGIAYLLGSMCLLIPGLIVLGFTFLSFPMVVEGGKGAIDAIKASIELTKKNWLMFTLFALALNFLAGIGAMACGVGILATYPLLFLGHSLAYRDLVGIPGVDAQLEYATPPAPPDYRDYAPTSYAPASYEPTPYAQPESAPWEAPTYMSPAPDPEPEPANKTCPNCGASLARVVNFCNQCGYSLRV